MTLVGGQALVSPRATLGALFGEFSKPSLVGFGGRVAYAHCQFNEHRP